MKPGIDNRFVFLLSITFLLIASGLVLPSAAKLGAQSSMVTNQIIEGNEIFIPIIANEYPLPCWQGIANGSFEDDSDWIIPTTEYPAGYSTTVAFDGIRSMRAGISDSQINRFSYSSARQIVTVPLEATRAVLSFQLYPKSSEPTSLSLPTIPLNIKKEKIL
jgi:hypothetical protein